ncbi:MAG: ATP synthase F0 subunit C [Bdellovibrionia bacterium]
MNFRKTLAWMGALMMSLGATAAFAAEEAAQSGGDPYRSLGAALAIGLAAFGGALGQAKVGAAALEGIGRNPAARDKVFVPMIIGLALLESLVLYAFLIALKLS